METAESDKEGIAHLRQTLSHYCRKYLFCAFLCFFSFWSSHYVCYTLCSCPIVLRYFVPCLTSLILSAFRFSLLLGSKGCLRRWPLAQRFFSWNLLRSPGIPRRSFYLQRVSPTVCLGSLLGLPSPCSCGPSVLACVYFTHYGSQHLIILYLITPTSCHV